MLQSTVVFSVSSCGMAHDRQQYLAQDNVFWPMCTTDHVWYALLQSLGWQTLEGAEPEGNQQLLKAVGVCSLVQHESYWPYAGCFFVDICSSISAKPAMTLQRCKGTKPWGAKGDQFGSSRMKHVLEEEEKNKCTFCNFAVVIDGVNLSNINM